MTGKTQSQVVADARRILESDDRIDAIKALKTADDDVAKKRTELEQAEHALRQQQQTYRDRYERAKKAWTVTQLRELGFAPPVRLRNADGSSARRSHTSNGDPERAAAPGTTPDSRPGSE